MTVKDYWMIREDEDEDAQNAGDKSKARL